MERSIDFVCGRTYDKNGNILSMKRKGRKGFPITSVEEAVYDDLSFAYDGNQLVAVADVAIGIEAVSKDGIVSVGKSGMQFADGVDEEEEYGYDANSNMVSDKNKGIGKIAYNTLNLPETVAFSGDDDIFNYQFWLSPIAHVNTVNFTYAADGTKLKSGYVTYKEVSAVQPARTNAFLPDSLRFGGGLLDSTRVIGPGTGRTFWLREVNTVTYAGNYQYENDTLSKKFFADGYIDCSGDEPVACFYLKDHLGNVRMVVDENGGIVQVNDYYPFGALYGSGTGDAAQRYKYNGKELDRMHGLDWYDYGARWMDPVLCRFTTMDPLCEKYYDTSPYAYCANNPMKYIDVNGDSINLAPLSPYGDMYTSPLMDDLQNKTGLTLSLSTNNRMVYAKDEFGQPIVSGGSVTARKQLMKLINSEDDVIVQIVNSRGSAAKDNFIGLNPNQIENFIEGAVNLDNETLGWGMTFLHESFHTVSGGNLKDNDPKGTVYMMNVIRQELNGMGGNFGIRKSYKGIPINGFIYIPFNDVTLKILKDGLAPNPTAENQFIKY